MSRKLIVIACLLGLTACTATSNALEPIPGSLIYGGQPATRLTKAPVGSSFTHRFIDNRGRVTNETYIIQPDRSLKLVQRYFEPVFRSSDNR